MKLITRFLVVCVILTGAIGCVKNQPFIASYTVPPVYDYGSKDSTALARVIMMHGIENYLATGASNQLNEETLEALWGNTDSSFTPAMVPDYLYNEEILNNMTIVSLAEAVVNRDSLKIFADSVVYLSRFNGQTAANGVAGVLLPTAATGRYLFDARGVEFKEVWINAMLGALSMSNVFSNLPVIAGSNSGLSWDAAYRYAGFPLGYDPAVDYSAPPLKADRPLAIAGLLGRAVSFTETELLYEEFRRGKASLMAGNLAPVGPAADSIMLYIEKIIAGAAIDALDLSQQTSGIAGKLHYLSQAYGLVWALKYGSEESPLSATEYWDLRDIFNMNFYSLVQDSSYTKIKEARSILATAFRL